jgi:hypothetical protein
MEIIASKTRFVFAIITIAILITACSTGDASANPILPTILTPAEGQPNGLPPAGSCENSLLPVVQGASWNYYSAGGPNGDFFYTDTITESTSTGFTLSSQFPSLTLTQKWFCAQEGLLALQLGGGTTASVSMQNMIADFKTKEISGVSLPRAITPGMQWDYRLVIEEAAALASESAQSPGTFNLTMQEMGSETIHVPAGVFETVKLQATFDAQINIDFQGSFYLYTVNGSSIHWYTPGVGLVKSIENIEFSGTPFTSTTELQSYSIP